MENYWDIDYGLERTENNKQSYLKILKCYYKESIEAKNILKNSVINKDYERYRIQIHSLKSNSLEIGAKELSELAKKLEFSAKDKNYEFINENSDIFLENYDDILEQIKNYVIEEEKVEEKESFVSVETSEEQIKEIFKTALKYLEEFEADLAVEVLEKIKFIEKASECIELIEDFEYEEAKEIINNF